MKIIQSLIDIELNFKIKYPLNEVCFLDIETTGLSRKYHQIYLIGILFYQSQGNLWKLIQFFCESSSEEELILKEFIKEVDKYKYLITYNGDNFDIPFLNEKLKKNDLKELNMESIDLYKVLRNNKDFIEFPNLKLKTVEKKLGIEREDTFSGLECIEFYKNYLITRSEHFFNYLINHNRDDLYSMPKLLRIFNLIEENRNVEIKFSDKDISLELIDIDQSGDLIIINGKSRDLLDLSVEYYNKFYSFKLNTNLDFQLKVEVNLAKIEEGIITYYVNVMELGFNSEFKDLSGYNPPKNILILKVNKKIILENIKKLLKEVLKLAKSK